jgi:hypothetical protein
VTQSSGCSRRYLVSGNLPGGKKEPVSRRAAFAPGNRFFLPWIRPAPPPVEHASRPFDTPSLGRRPSSGRATGKYRLARWRPNGTQRGIATAFVIAPAIPLRGADASDQSSRRLSRRGRTKSFLEDARVQSSSSAGPDSPHAQAIGGRRLRAGSLGPRPAEQVTKQGAKPFERDPEAMMRIGWRPTHSMNQKHQKIGTRVVAVPTHFFLPNPTCYAWIARRQRLGKSQG